MVPEYLDVPVFPLPNVALFPRTFLPLHVFEPRYRALTESCLRGDRLMGVALLREGWQRDYFGRPPIHRVFGVGRIVHHERRDDGRFDIVLEGVYRVRLIEEFEGAEFRVARTLVLADPPLDERAEVAPLGRELLEGTRELARLVPELREGLRGAWAATPHPVVVSDAIASIVVVDPYDRQSILSEDDPVRRMKLTLVQLRRVLQEVGRDEVREEVAGDD